MARSSKDRLEYFPLDVDYTEDPKFEALQYYCGNIGEIVILDI
jgi:hypothetical protein